MSEIIKVIDYDNETLSFIIEQFKNAEKLKGMIQASNVQGNYIEDAMFELRDEFWLSTALSAQLDVIGSILVLTRNGLSEADYRTALYSWINIIKGSGETENIYEAIRLLYSPDEIEYTPFYPGKYYIFTWDTTAAETVDLNLTLMESLSPSGVQPLQLFPLYFEDGNPISLEPTSTDPKDDYLYKVN